MSANDGGMDDSLLSTVEAAAYTKVSVTWLKRLSRLDKGPPVAVRGGPRRGNKYRRADLDAWLKAGRGYMRAPDVDAGASAGGA